MGGVLAPGGFGFGFGPGAGEVEAPPRIASHGTTREIVSKVPFIRSPARTPFNFHVPREPTIPKETFPPSRATSTSGVVRPSAAT